MSTETILTPEDPEWHERRRDVYTGSDMGVLFGLPGFGHRTLSDVWWEKRYGVKPDKGTMSTRLGNKLESVVLDEAEEHVGRIINRQKWLRNGNIGATIDGQVESDGRPTEAKTSGLLWKPDEEWGDGGDEVPAAIALQVQCQIFLTGTDSGLVPALIGGRGFMLYEIPRHDGLIAEMQRKATEFIASLEGDTPPPEPPQLETLKRLRRQPSKVIERSDVLDELYEQLEEAKANAKATEETKERLQRQVLAILGDAEAAECNGGLITYYEQSRKESYVAASTFRVMRFKKGTR